MNLSAPNQLPRKQSLACSYITTCKVCRFGIYQGQTWEWCRKPLGMVHNDCLRRPS